MLVLQLHYSWLDLFPSYHLRATLPVCVKKKKKCNFMSYITTSPSVAPYIVLTRSELMNTAFHWLWARFHYDQNYIRLITCRTHNLIKVRLGPLPIHKLMLILSCLDAMVGPTDRLIGAITMYFLWCPA